jgi:anti-sigma B factor antagonist
MNHKLENYEVYSIYQIEEEKMDTTVAPEVKSAFMEAHAQGIKNMIVDLSAVKYADSSGLSALLVGNRSFGEAGTFVIFGVQDHVKKLVSISMLDKVLNIVPSREEAVDFVFMSALEREMGEEGEQL